MLTCSAEEIAEKRRRALEKLQGRKVGGHLIANINKSSAESMAATSVSRPMSSRPVNSSSSSSSFVSSSSTVSSSTTKSSSTSSIKSSSISTSTTSSKPYSSPLSRSKTPQNKASAFLNAISSNKQLMERLQQQRSEALTRNDAVHPYQRNEVNVRRTLPAIGTKSLIKPRVQTTLDIPGSTTNCQAYVISPKRFEVDAPKFHPQLINIFKSLTSKNYDSNTKRWNFDLSEYPVLQERLLLLHPHVVMSPIPSTVVDLCKKALQRKAVPELLNIDLADRLMPFQEEGVRFAIGQQGRVMICDEMGLGKTYQALAIADYYKDDWPLLICTTATTRDSWYRHVKDLLSSRLSSENQIQFLNSSSNQNEIKGGGGGGDVVRVMISSYHMMERHFNTTLKDYEFGVLIFDESHSLKNSKAKCTMAATHLAQRARRVILLSGTPALSRPVELFSQLKMIDRKFMDFMEYSTRYCNGKVTNFGWDANGQSNLQELNVILKLKFMIRRTKAEVLNDLSNKKRETVILDPLLVWCSDGKAKASLASTAKHFQESKGADREQLLLNYYSETASVKIKAVCSYLEKLVQESGKFIVFGHHRTMLNGICDCMKRLHVNYIRIDGSTKNQDRGQLVERFQSDERCQVAILSLGACNSGITLTAANLIVFAELTWNPSTLAQAEARVHRIGQKNDVICRYLIASNTADDCIWQMLQNKQKVLKEAGIFCENLGDTTHHSHHRVMKSSQSRVEDFFPSQETNLIEGGGGIGGGGGGGETNTTPPSMEKNMEINENDIAKELVGIVEAFQDDDSDDDVFKDILL